MTSNGEKTSFTVTARFFGSFKQVTQKREIEIALPEGGTIANLLAKVIGDFPRLQGLILDENLQLGSWVVILINGRNMKINKGLKTCLKEGDLIAIFPPVAGG